MQVFLASVGHQCPACCHERDLVVGILGALIGGLLLGGSVLGGGLIGSIVVATLGAVTLLVVLRVIKKA